MLTIRKRFAGTLAGNTGEMRLKQAMTRILAFAGGFLLWAVASAVAQPAVVPGPGPAVAAAMQPQPASAPVVLDARIGEHADRTRFVVEFSDPVKFRVFTLANPDRVVIDMPEVLWRLNGPPVLAGRGAVHSYRYGLFRPGNSRFVIELNGPVTATDPLVLPPEDGYGYRLVLDLFPTTQAAFDKHAGWPADLRAREAAAAQMASVAPDQAAGETPPPAAHGTAHKGTSTRKVIVIDPGHGGIDSGTIGITGMEEKNVVLDVGKRLAADLRARGYTVYMTRTTDVFIPLFDRDPFARRHHADLFISLHSDSNPDKGVHGASVYTLSEKGSDKEAAALARQENQSDIIAGVDLSGDNSSVASILIDLAQRDTMNKSSRFATEAVGSLRRTTDILAPEPHRSANFVVLRSPDVPGALIELGYLSNTDDCHQMATSDWRNRAAGAIADAVDRQFAPVVASPVTGERAVE